MATPLKTMQAYSPFLQPSFWTEPTPWLSMAPGGKVDGALKAFIETHPETTGLGLLGFQTSGSTGAPKWVIIEKSAFLASARAVNAHLQSTNSDRWMIPLPTHHVAGFSILARCFLSGASFETLEGSWNAQTFWDQLSDGQCTLCSLVPTQVYDLVKLKLSPPPSLRAVLVGGGGINPELREAAIRLGWPLLQSFGMTEASSGIATEPLSAGFPLIEVPLEVLPIWKLSLSETQTLRVQGAALAKGYAVREAHGWSWDPISEAGLVTRDRVELIKYDGKTSLKFLGRDASFIKVKGELLHLGVIQARWESLVMNQALQVDAVILSMPDARRDEKLVLAVARGADEKILQHLIHQYHEASPPTEKLHERCWVDEIPRSDLGKVRMEALRQKCAQVLDQMPI